MVGLLYSQAARKATALIRLDPRVRANSLEYPGHLKPLTLRCTSSTVSIEAIPLRDTVEMTAPSMDNSLE